MKRLLNFCARVLLVGVLVHISCKKEKTLASSSQALKLAPIANAGSDQIIIPPVDSATLTGKGIDLDGTVVGYSWKYLSGPIAAFTIANSNRATTIVHNLGEGVYVFELVVIDNEGLIGRDEVIIFVGDPLDSCAGCWDY